MADNSRVNYPPDPNPKKPKWTLPKGAWDTHFHVIGPSDVYPYTPTRRSTPPAAPWEHIRAVQDFLGLERGVVVQSSAHGVDTKNMVDTIRRSEGRLHGGIVLEDSLHYGADPKQLKADGVVGVRLNLGHHASEFPDDQARFDRIIAAAVQMNWIVTLHFDAKVLVEMAEWVRRIPQPTVIDNYAGIDARLGVDQPAVRTLVDLAKEPHIWLKTAAANRMMLKGATYEQIRPIGRAVHAASPCRTIWGTDWPHSDVWAPNMVPNDGDQLDWVLDFQPDETSRRKMFVDNPKRLFEST